MEKARMIIRILLGLMVFVFGWNKFFHFIPMPPSPGAAGEYMGALAMSGFIFPIVGAVQIISGALLLSNKYTALALVLLFPVMLNAFLFHFFLDIAGIGGSAFVLVSIVILMFGKLDQYRGMLQA